MKDHKKVEKTVDLYAFDGWSVEQACAELTEIAEGLINPVLRVDIFYEDVNLYVDGWRPMTEKERVQAHAKALRAKDDAERRLQTEIERDRAELIRLADKLGERIA